MDYSVLFTPRARKLLAALDETVKRRVIAEIEKLA